MIPSRQEILLFTRYPRPGKVKTRLAKELGAAEAARIHVLLTERTVATALRATAMPDIDLSVCYTGGTADEMRSWLGNGLRLVRQRGDNLGQRMATAFRDAWKRGAASCILVGSDCPGLDAALLTEALDLVRSHDIVLGPASDGGYYLVGLQETVPEEAAFALLTGSALGTASAFAQTTAQAARLGLTIATTKELHDIDRPEDLKHLDNYSCPQ